mmetsp:Transcript_56343/g.111979  ORF Transcript_56343/g.111979 Transcript_56343/m.111979 type:complete len:193 (+) Transcript_56343:764-1342(+)
MEIGPRGADATTATRDIVSDKLPSIRPVVEGYAMVACKRHKLVLDDLSKTAWSQIGPRGTPVTRHVGAASTADSVRSCNSLQQVARIAQATSFRHEVATGTLAVTWTVKLVIGCLGQPARQAAVPRKDTVTASCYAYGQTRAMVATLSFRRRPRVRVASLAPGPTVSGATGCHGAAAQLPAVEGRGPGTVMC